ncbi:MAG: DnaJ subfamily C member 9 [Marteilia pararefringens]
MNERSRIYYLETRGEVLDKEIASAEFDFTKLLELTRVHLTDEKITKISERYRNSDQERKDIIELYQLYEGNMEKILFDVDFASIDDLDRITKIIQAAIDSNDIEHFKKFDKGVSKSFLRKYKREAAGLEKMKLEEELNNARLPSKLEEDLIKRQSKSQALFDAMIADAEKKFAPKKRVTKKSKKI